MARYLDQRPNGYAGAMGVIRGEINKRRGHRPIRKLMTDAGSAIQLLKPIFLMSPLSVAQFLPPGRLNFSILVIDEASQVAPEDALGVVARANQIVVIVVGLLVERFLIRRMYNRELAEQLLLTFALVLILGDVIKLIWGVENRRIFVPVTPVEAFGAFINPYYFFLIGAGLAVAIGLWLFLHRTKYGKIVRAAVYSREMVSALGIRIPLIYAGVFAAGIGIAAFAAGIFSPLLPMALGVDIDIIIQCFAVVVIGGFGSILGTFVASLLVGIVYSFSILLWPNGAVAVIFLIVIAVLIWRPWGLFGTELRS